jgi:hypothetical protein
MEDSSFMSESYLGKLERVSQDKRAGTLTSCYTNSRANQFV